MHLRNVTIMLSFTALKLCAECPKNNRLCATRSIPERQRERDREGQRERERQRGTERQRQRDRQTETEKNVPYIIKFVPEQSIDGKWIKEHILDSLKTLKNCGFRIRPIASDNNSVSVLPTL